MPNKQRKKYNYYEFYDTYVIGYTFNNIKFYIDLEDYNKIKSYCWYSNGSGYICAYNNVTKKEIIMHRLIMNANNKLQVDHINHNKKDNRKNNLRLVTRQQNAMNHVIPNNNTSGCTGVHFEKDRKIWRAYITLNGQRKYLGRFKNKQDAINARKNAEVKYFGEYRYNENSY